MQRLLRPIAVAVVLISLFVLGASQVWLAQIDGEGPPRRWLQLPGDVPAILHLPGVRPVGPPPPPRPPKERPPAIVLVHGHAGDLVGMSGLARSLVRAGFAVLTIDLRGHGQNARPFNEGSGRPDQFDLEIRAALEYLRHSDEVDGARIALAGHSMGAGAVLQYATRDTLVDAVVPIAGGWEMSGPHRPPNVFFVYAENDLPGIPESARALASRLVGGTVVPDRLYGALDADTGVQLHVVPGANHLSIIRSDDTVREIAGWLDGVWKRSRGGALGFHDPRDVPVRVALGAFLIVLIGLGAVVGRMAARLEPPDSAGTSRLAHLVPIALSLSAVLPFFAMWFPAFLVNTTEADPGVSFLGSVGIVLLVGLQLSGTLAERLGSFRPGQVAASVAVAAAAVAAGYVLFAPWAVTLRGLSPTPERALLLVGIAAVLLPFTLGFHLLTSGESAWRSALLRVLARVLVIAAFSLGLLFEIFWFPTRIQVGVLFVTAFQLELVFASYYANSRNVITAATFEALWLGWVLAVVMPASL